MFTRLISPPSQWKSGARWSRHAINELLDEAEQKDDFDMMRDLATPLPVLVIAEMMGVPVQDRPHIRAIAEKLLNIARGEADRLPRLVEGMEEMLDYVNPMMEERIVNPGDDFISVLAQGEKAGVFTREQSLVNTSLLLLAGHETTINLICNGTLAFMQNRDQWDLLKADPQGMMVRANEEALRYDSPVKSIQRLAAQDVEMRGKLIKKDDRLRWFIPSANRDPNKFERPDEMDITRWPNPPRLLRRWHPPLPGRNHRPRGRAGSVPRTGRALPRHGTGPGRYGIRIQHHLPLHQADAHHHQQVERASRSDTKGPRRLTPGASHFGASACC